MLAVKLTNVRKNFGLTEVLKGINLELAAGVQCAIMGASGCGKSTLLHLLAGLDSVTSGGIEISGRKLHLLKEDELALYRNRQVGLVFQFHYLLPSLNCIGNILLPAKIGGLSRNDILKIEESSRKLSMRLGVESCLKKYPYEISGGEQQRINIIRALSLRPQLLLADEPTGNLDSLNSDKVISLLMELAQEYRATLLVVTHNDRMAARFRQQIVMADGLLQSSECNN